MLLLLHVMASPCSMELSITLHNVFLSFFKLLSGILNQQSNTFGQLETMIKVTLCSIESRRGIGHKVHMATKMAQHVSLAETWRS